ncbi:hypothetical protein BDQ17DRAFT_1392896 [Cyathus striatus]|nr:hypothetical protein BDQ17DRAFT_1392896 [Cyathus striatus]
MNTVLKIADGTKIDDVTRHAFTHLREEAAVAQVDKNQNIPALTGRDTDRAARDAAEARYSAQGAMNLNENSALVNMVVVDGIVMGPAHCAIENCTQDLVNARQVLHKNLCRVNGCNKNLVQNTKACEEHQQKWQSHFTRFGRQSLLGINRQVQTHDIISSREEKKKDYFSPSQFYCVETICAPCGVVLAWAKFDKSESIDQIFDFLEKVFPTEDVQPTCVLLKSAATNGKWIEVTDYICCKWCNPAPLNGSAPNLVVVEHDVNGVPHYKCAFNTQRQQTKDKVVEEDDNEEIGIDIERDD